MRGARGTEAGRLARLDPSLPQVLAIVIGLRLALGAVAWLSLHFFPITGVSGDWLNLRLPDSAPMAPFIGSWERWDALWYHHLAAAGYHTPSDAAFFPLYPTLMRAGAGVLGGAYLLSGMLISTFAFGVGLILLHRLVRSDVDGAVADRAITYVALAPTAFFFLAPYTEALFLVLTVANFLALRRKAWSAASALAALAVLTRPTGILIMAPVAVAFCRDVRDRRRAGQRMFSLGHLTLLTPVAALAAWFLYATAVLHVQGGPASAYAPWTRGFAPPWKVLSDSWSAITSGGHPEEVFNLGAVAMLIVSIPLMWGRLPREYVAYAAALVPVLLTREVFSSPLGSAARYVVVVFPLFVVLAMAGRKPWVDRALIATFAPLMTLLFVFYVHYGFAG